MKNLRGLPDFFKHSFLIFFFFLPQGYERILDNPQRPGALGLQAAGWQGLQHAPHRVKGKNLWIELFL